MRQYRAAAQNKAAGSVRNAGRPGIHDSQPSSRERLKFKWHWFELLSRYGCVVSGEAEAVDIDAMKDETKIPKLPECGERPAKDMAIFS